MSRIAGEGTAERTASTVLPQHEEDHTSTSAEYWGVLRDRARVLDEDTAGFHGRVADEHHVALARRHAQVAKDRSGREPVTLLRDLSDAGLAWRDVARIIGVSIPALRKWRKGLARPTAEHRQRIAELVALIDLLAAEALVDDPAGWLESAIHPDAPVTGLDMAAEAKWALLLALALGHTSGEEVLDRHMPDWREAFDSEWEAEVRDDGDVTIRRRVD